MNRPVWVCELAERFWAAAGSPPSFPRDLRAAATRAATLSVLDRPHLRLSTVTEYLSKLRGSLALAEPDRPLRAALYCWRGTGFLFLDSTDPPGERRFSLAHEVAHFLRDYDALRRKVTRALGTDAHAVLDGERAATTDERVHALLRGVSLAPHTHFMNRDNTGRPKGNEERQAEADADRLAFELLAPAELLAGETDRPALEARLVAEFGLPPSAARDYAFLLLPPPQSVGMIVERIRNLV